MEETRINLGKTLKLNDTVDITDPCYDKGTWCRHTVPVVPGEYLTTIYRENSENRVSAISICHKSFADRYDLEWAKVCNIGVDAGLAGFFNNKPDYNDEEWSEFCNKIFAEDEKKIENLKSVYLRDDAFFSESGYGDGVYEVFGKLLGDKYVALEIVFIGDEEDEYY